MNLTRRLERGDEIDLGKHKVSLQIVDGELCVSVWRLGNCELYVTDEPGLSGPNTDRIRGSEVVVGVKEFGQIT